MAKSKFHDSLSYDDVEGSIGLVPVDVLCAVMRGEIDLNELASYQLANMGLNDWGQWVGFPKAAELHQIRLSKIRKKK